ncbi:MAG: amidohydrolase [Saprospiraceae bacterium]|nr:amidohydrolase [Saprospiraceae bacterium]
MIRFRTLFIFCLVLLFASCTEKPSADLIILNANVWTVNPNQPKAEAIAISDGNILQIGNSVDIAKLKNEDTQEIDAKGAFVMPGWIEGHGHFSGLGKSLQNLNFLKSKNWDEIVAMVAEKAKTLEPGEWIEGRGWHQEKWDKIPEINFHGYPDHNDLSRVSPDNPVILRHASGHSLFANQKAMEISGVNRESGNPMGGEIVKDGNGDPIGVFEERAMALIYESFQEYERGLSKEEVDKKWFDAISIAEQECITKGITSFQDAGSQFFELDRYEEMAEKGELDLRLWAMVRHSSEDMKGKLADVKAVGVGNNFYTCNAIKSEVDGALGAFGAWLLEPYADKPGFVGQNTTDIGEVKTIAEMALEEDMQLCVHAIGDRANRVVVDIYEGMLSQKEKGAEKRWRIEHAQHLDPADIPRFAKNGIIASMQGIHCTSDAPFVEKRLGNQRAKLGAYAWRSLLDNDVIIANGTDAPVEDVDPIPSFYASVTRKRIDNGMEFFTEQSMTREEAIHSYTLGNAFAAFEEDIKGSIEPGKVADLTIMSKDLIQCTEEEILESEVLYTIINGTVKYKKEM